MLLGVATFIALTTSVPAVHSTGQLQGDADCSGGVGSPDAVGILGHVASVDDAACADAADTNCDNHVDIRDALNVLLFLSDLDPATPDFCDPIDTERGPVVIAIDESLEPTKTVESLDGGPPPKVEVVEETNGLRTEFVGDEVLYSPDDVEDLQAFLAEHNGTIIRDDTISIPAASSVAGGQPIHTGSFLIRVDPSGSDFSELSEDLANEGLAGKVIFSSEEAAGALALAVGDESGKTDLNALGDVDASWEHPDSPTSFINADSDYNYFASGPSSLLNIGVAAAWRYLRYQEIVQAADAIPFQATRVAIIDQGFALASSGYPLGGNTDFFPAGGIPAQYDVVDDDYRAGGYKTDCADDFGTDFQACRWHGTASFAVCCAITNNYFGGAGTAGNYVVPILIRTDDRVSSWSEGIWAAIALEADVMNISMGYICDWFCGWTDGDIGDATDYAGTHGAIIVASAGNHGVDIGGDDRHRPCEFPKVVCVGGMTAGQFNTGNWGSPVDIWAPEGLKTTVAPDDPNPDDNDYGLDELMNYKGTSSASPYVAGIVALMKSLKPTLTYSEALIILGNTANASENDPGKIDEGYVNALQAVLATKPNQPPVIQNVRVPVPKETYGYAGATFRVDAYDPEPGTDLPEFANSTVAVFFIERPGVDEVLCAGAVVVYRNGIPGYECPVTDAPIGTFNIIVWVTDPFLGRAVAEINEVTFVNTAPVVEITDPTDGATFYATQSIEFDAIVFDPEETVPFPQHRVVWQSDIDNQIGTGTMFEASLSQGDHTITVTATDSKGVSVSDSITVHILSGAGIPTVAITSPEDGASFGPDTQVTFIGNATDPEDGPLSGDSLDWYSDISGFLGSGEQITYVFPGGGNCFYQSHTITLRATDSDAHEVTDQITVVISIFC